MRRPVKAVGWLLLLALVIVWAEWKPDNPKHPHCGRTTKWFLIQPSDFQSLVQRSPKDPLDKWQITSCFTSAEDCNSYRLQQKKEWNEGEGAELNNTEPFFKELTQEYAAARCMSVNDPEIIEAVKLHGPFVMPEYDEEDDN